MNLPILPPNGSFYVLPVFIQNLYILHFEFLTIYCFVFLLKNKPWGSFQVNEAPKVVFMILGGCFIGKIVLNLPFRWVKKILVKSDSMFTLACEQVLHVRVSQSKRWTINFHWWKNIVRPIKGRERCFFTEWNFIVLDADWLLLIRNDYYAQPYRWINLYTHIINKVPPTSLLWFPLCFAYELVMSF